MKLYLFCLPKMLRLHVVTGGFKKGEEMAICQHYGSLTQGNTKDFIAKDNS